MKKIFTLIAVAMMAVGGAMAQTSKEWNFSTWTSGDITATKTVDGLTVYATETGKVTVDANNKTVDGVKYTQRIKMGGTAAWNGDTKAPEARILAFAVPGACKIKIIACSASGSEDRNFAIATGASEDDIIAQKLATSTVTSYEVDYSGTATTIYIYSLKSGVNFYDISYTSTGTGISNINAEATNAPVYSLAGQRVNANAKGLVIKNGKKYVNK